MKLENLQPGDVVDRWRDDEPPMLYERRTEVPGLEANGVEVILGYTYYFRDLETWEEVYVCTVLAGQIQRSKSWELLKRSLPSPSSGSVDSDDGSHQQADQRKEAAIMTQQNLTSDTTVETIETQAVPAVEPTKGKKTRTVDYTRTDKRPHSFRYKRHSTFVARSGVVTLSKDADGAFVIGPAPEGSTAEAGKLEAGQLELVSVKKRPNGKTAIAFSHPDLGVVVAYDARAARAALRAG